MISGLSCTPADLGMILLQVTGYSPSLSILLHVIIDINYNKNITGFPGNRDKSSFYPGIPGYAKLTNLGNPHIHICTHSQPVIFLCVLRTFL